MFCLGAWLAGFAGVIGGPDPLRLSGLDQEMLPLALVVVILGGSGSLLGSLVGSFVVGFLYNFGQAMFPELAYVVLFLPMLHRAGGAAAGPLRAAGRVSALAARRRARGPGRAAAAGSGGTYYVNIASQILLYAVFALGVNVLAGYAGPRQPGPRRALRHRGLRGRCAS